MDKILDHLDEYKPIYYVLAGFTLIILFLYWDYSTGDVGYVDGVVIEKIFIPEHFITTTTYVNNTPTYSQTLIPDEYNLITDIAGFIFYVSTDRQGYYTTKINDKVTAYFVTGGITGISYGYNLATN